MKNILLIGGGWAGIGFLNYIDQKKYNVSVVSNNNFTYTPLLANSISRKINLELNLSKKYNFTNDLIKDVNFDEKFVVGKNKIPYDYVVFSHGSSIQTFNIKGVDDNCFFLKNQDDSVKIKKILNDIKNIGDDQKSIAVIGCGLTGSEIIGNLIDLNFDNKLKITAIDGVERPLVTWLPEVSSYVNYIWNKNNVSTIFSKFVSRIDKNKIYFKDDSELPINYDVAIWCGGIKKSFLTENILKKLKLENRFGIPVDKQLKIINTNDAYAIGDCGYNGFPPTAQNAFQEGKFLANYFNSNFKKNEYNFNSKGQICYIGESKSVYQFNKYYTFGEFTNIFNKLVHIYNGFQVSNELGFNILSSYFKDK